MIQYNGETKIETTQVTPSELKLGTPRNIEIVVCLICRSWNLKVQLFSELFKKILRTTGRDKKCFPENT